MGQHGKPGEVGPGGPIGPRGLSLSLSLSAFLLRQFIVANERKKKKKGIKDPETDRVPNFRVKGTCIKESEIRNVPYSTVS